MDIMEIILLIAGGIVFILSFVVSTKKDEDYEETKGLAKEEIRNLVSEELEAVRGHVDDVVEEAVTYSMEKTERSLERLSNEKIMAVNEYSDTVLSEIHKNHEEVMFLYDMLNDKHINLKNTVSEVNKTVKEAAETVSEVNKTVKEAAETKREAEEVVNTFQRLAPETVTAAVAEGRVVNSLSAPQISKPLKTRPTVPIELIQPQISAFLQSAKTVETVEPIQSMQQTEPQQFMQPVQILKEVQVSTKPLETMPIMPIEPMAQMSAYVPQKQSDAKPEPAAFRGASLPAGAISFTQETDERGRNYNDVILDLYKKGKSKVAIAKELNLGVGEVNLVIDLYNNL